MDRMLHIHQAVKDAKYPTASTLAKEMEVSAKSIQRDIDFMRDRLKMPLHYDFYRNGWMYTEKVTAFPSLQITEGEVVALVMAEKALKQYRGTTFEKPLLSAIQKMQDSLPDTISVSLADMDRSISFQTRVEPIVNMEIFDALARATATRRQIVIDYRKPAHASPEKRTIDPYHFANINGEWYLFAYDHGRKDIRTFVPARVKSVKQTGRTFKLSEKFSLEKRLRDSFGVHSGEGEFEVVLRFTNKVADYIREKRWHDSQVLKELKGGEVELKMKLSSLGEVERWVLSWGGNATVVRPKELAKSVHESAKRLLSHT
jgi:predicted DNA-binding transcriptional regulator YafY